MDTQTHEETNRQAYFETTKPLTEEAPLSTLSAPLEQTAAASATMKRQPQWQETEIRPLSMQAPPVFAPAPDKKSRKKSRVDSTTVNRKDISGTRSDVVRLVTKTQLLEDAKVHLTASHLSRTFTNILNDIIEYSNIDATSHDSKLLKRENELAIKIRASLEKYSADEKTSEAERNLAKTYSLWFGIEMDGLLQIPSQTTDENVRFYNNGNPISVDKKQCVPKPVSIWLRDATKEPLFPHAPSISDIRQGTLGDCFLLAGLASIVNRDPMLIRQAMKDNKNGTVTVRFYNKYTDADTRTESSETVYVTVDKKVPRVSQYAKESLWVQMLERAYTASGMNKKNNRGKKMPDPADREVAYKDIDGGHAYDFIYVMTGQEYKRNDIHGDTAPPSEQTSEQFMKRFAESFFSDMEFRHMKEEENHAALKALRDELKDRRDVFQEINKPTADAELIQIMQNTVEELERRYEVIRRNAFRRKLLGIKKPVTADEKPVTTDEKPVTADDEKISAQRNAVEALLGSLKIGHEGKGKHKKTKKTVHYMSGLPRWEEVQERLAATDFDKALPSPLFTEEERNIIKVRLIRKLEKWDNATIPKIYKAFSGIYSANAEERYQEIEDALKSGKLVTASSKTYVPEDVAGAGGLNSEHLHAGIVERHAYTILGTEIKDGNRFIRVKNPWGSGSMEYFRKKDEFSSEMQQTDDRGIFLIELNDFMEKFGHFALSAS
ncbi:MAG: hypothetical protein LBQ21_06370 [Clostridiales Family XIII bacterium]|jgi:hypothetical protein|nr:hypothetical protein [Clostridiales Family XIII bacterium]